MPGHTQRPIAAPGDLGQFIRLSSLSFPHPPCRSPLSERRGELHPFASAPPPPRSSQSGGAARGVCPAQGPRLELGGGASGAVTAPRDPTGNGRGAARVVGTRLAPARGGGAGQGPGTLRPHGWGGGAAGAEVAALLAPPPSARSPSGPAGGGPRPQVPGGGRARAREGVRGLASPALGTEGGGPREEGPGSACARPGGAELETRGQGTRAHAETSCGSPRAHGAVPCCLPPSAGTRLRILASVAVAGAGGFAEVGAGNRSDAGSFRCSREGGPTDRDTGARPYGAVESGCHRPGAFPETRRDPGGEVT